MIIVKKILFEKKANFHKFTVSNSLKMAIFWKTEDIVNDKIKELNLKYPQFRSELDKISIFDFIKLMDIENFKYNRIKNQINSNYILALETKKYLEKLKKYNIEIKL